MRYLSVDAYYVRILKAVFSKFVEMHGYASVRTMVFYLTFHLINLFNVGLYICSYCIYLKNISLVDHIKKLYSAIKT